MPKQINPNIIDNAPVTPGSQVEGDDDQDSLARLAELSSRLADAESENERLRTKKTVEDVRVSMMEPYANRVFWFVVWYCGIVGGIIFIQGLGYVGQNHEPFKLSDTVIGIIAGSTAASVIGLIGIVVSGLFGARNAE